MKKPAKRAKRISKIELQKAAIGYETAIQLWAAESQNRMATYNSMLVANSLILAGIGLSYQTSNFFPSMRLLLGIMGIFLCAIWYLSEKRVIEKAICWFYCAREIEDRYFTDVFETLKRGYSFSRGEPVQFFRGGEKVYRRMKFPGRLLKNQFAFNSVIFLFVVMYLCVFAIYRFF